MNARDSRPRRRWPILLLALLSALSIFLHATLALRTREVSRAAKSFAALRASRPIAATKARRARYYQIAFFQGHAVAAAHACAVLADRLQRSARPLRLRAIQIAPALHHLEFTVTAEAGPGGAAGLRQRLASLPDVYDVTVLAMPPAGAGPSDFALAGRMELQP